VGNAPVVEQTKVGTNCGRCQEWIKNVIGTSIELTGCEESSVLLTHILVNKKPIRKGIRIGFVVLTLITCAINSL